jgi:hypothetical protein
VEEQLSSNFKSRKIVALSHLSFLSSPEVVVSVREIILIDFTPEAGSHTKEKDRENMARMQPFKNRIDKRTIWM